MAGGPEVTAGSQPDQKHRRFRIAIFAETFPPNSGGVSAAHYSLASLLETRHDVRLFAFEDSRPSTGPISRAIGRGGSGRMLAFAAARLVSRSDARGGSPISQRIARTVAAIRRLNRPLAEFRPDIVFVPDFCVPALALKTPPNARLIWVAHHNYKRFERYPLVRVSGWYDSFLAHRLEKRALRKCDYAVFPSTYMERIFRETLDPSLPGSVIHNNVDLARIRSVDRSRARAKLGLKPESLLVYLPSAGTAPKGERYVFEIVRRLMPGRDVRFFVSGPIDSRLRIELSQLIASGGVIAPGRLSHEQNLEMVAASDLAISPALVENFSCALLEAQGLGQPCVTFNTGGNAELIVDGETGFVVPYLDTEGLIQRSTQLLDDATLRTTMGDAARARADRICDPVDLLPRYEHIMSLVSNDKPRPN